MKERVPVIIAVTDAAFIGELTKELALSKTFRLGGFTVLKPDDAQGLLRRLHIAAELEEPAAQPDKQPPSLEEMATTVLRKLAVPCNLKGFRCLRDAIVLAAEDVGYLQQIVQKLYPEVAQRNNTTPPRVERAMRHAISAAEKRLGPEAMEGFFHTATPTNSEFIATIADAIARKREKDTAAKK